MVKMRACGSTATNRAKYSSVEPVVSCLGERIGTDGRLRHTMVPNGRQQFSRKCDTHNVSSGTCYHGICYSFKNKAEKFQVCKALCDGSTEKVSSKPSFGLFLNSASPIIAEQMGHVGYDWLLVDAQHSRIGVPDIAAMIGSVRSTGTKAYIRVPSPSDRPSIQQAVDVGAVGVMIPTIKTIYDVEQAIDSIYFPPMGSRSIAFPIRPQLGRSVEEYLDAANKEISLILQVETRQCLDNLEDIAKMPGVDALFVGPFDISLDLGLLDKYGYPDGMKTEEFRNVLRRVADVCNRHGNVIPGCFASPGAGAEELLEIGYKMIATGTDVSLIGKAAALDVQSFQNLQQQQNST